MEPARAPEGARRPDPAAEDLGAVGRFAPSGGVMADGVPPERGSRRLERGTALRRNSLAVLLRARRELVSLARTPGWWLGLAVSVAVAVGTVIGPLHALLLAAADYTEPWRDPKVAVAEALPVLALWALPLALCPWALLTGVAAPLRPRHAAAQAALARILGRGLLVGAAAAAVHAMAGAALGAHEPLVAASAASGAWTAALLTAVGIGVRAAVVHRAWSWAAAAAAVLWLGAGNAAAAVWLLPTTEDTIARHYAVNVERDADGMLVSYECTDFELTPYTGQRSEMVVWLAAANPALVAVAATGDAMPRGSVVAWTADAYKAAAVGPSAWEPCLEGHSTSPGTPAPLDVLGHTQLAATSAVLVGIGALRGRIRRSRVGAGRQAQDPGGKLP